MRLTAPNIKTLKLPEGVTDYVFFDERLPGFGLRQRASGSKSFVFQYAIAGKTKKFTIGEVDPGKAFDIAKDLHAQVRVGRDPVAEKKQTRIHAAETMGAILPRYLTRQRARIRHNSFILTTRYLENYARSLHASPIATLDRRMVAAVLLAVADKHGNRTSNRVRSTLCAFFSWAVREGLVAHNEAAYTNKAPENGPRERVLTGEELRTIWHALEDDTFGAMVKLLMLTACRRDEIGLLNWCEVDLSDAAQINLPGGERTKNGKPHTVPLSHAAVAILTKQQQQRPGSGRVFSDNARGFGGWAYSKSTLDARITVREGKPLAPWVFHDFRRSASTWMHDNAVAPHIVEAILGHYSGHRAGVAGVYNRAQYILERRRALERWADHITGLTASKVVPFRA
jgi:integrase